MFSYVIIRKVCSSYYSWYMLLVDGGSMICNQIYLIPRAATWTLLLFRGNTDVSSRRSVGVLHYKPAPRETDEDASQPLPPAES